MRHLVPHGQVELWRDPTSTVSIVEVPLHPGWVSKPLKALEDATGTRAAFLIRFGIGTLPTASTTLQDGDQVFMMVTDDMINKVIEITGAEPANA
jgi:trk system potassium uptake protein TrkA